MFINNFQILNKDPKSEIKLFLSGILFTMDCKVVAEGLDEIVIFGKVCIYLKFFVLDVVVGGACYCCC